MGAVTRGLDRVAETLGTLSRHSSPAALLVVALVLGTGFRVVVATAQPLDDHEKHYIADAEAVRHAHGNLAEAMRGNVHGWLPALAYGAILEALPSAGALELRLVQTGASVIAIAMVFALGAQLSNPRVGAVAAVLYALDPEAVWHGAFVGPYSSHVVLVTAMLATYLGVLRGAIAPAWAAALAAATTLSLYHHPVSLVYVLALATHGATQRQEGRRRAWALGALALAALLAVPGWAGGQPGKVEDLLLARLPDFFGKPLVMGAVFLALWDAAVDRFEPRFHRVLPFVYLVPLACFMPYFREAYVLPGAVPWALVVAAALVDGTRPRLAALACLHLALADAGLWLQALGGAGP